MTTRRRFLTGLLATGVIPAPTWADAGAPAYVAAAALGDGSFVLCGLRADGVVVFQIPIPDRGHAAATHPIRPEVVAFARRPGTFAVVLDCRTGQPIARLTSPRDRHFYGHGVFSKDGQWLFTTENDFEAGLGCVGVWDVSANYTRIGEFPSGGVGPHDIRRLPDSEVLVIANGGIDTHPDSGRAKLNIPSMQPNLCYVNEREIIEIASLPAELHKGSIRHLAVSQSGQVAFGMQWQGDTVAPALVGLHVRGGPPVVCHAPANQTRMMQGYVGSIAFGHDPAQFAVTSPRGNSVQVFETQTAKHIRTVGLQDACGIAAHGPGFMVTGGTGDIHHLDGYGVTTAQRSALKWDNHLVPV